MEDGLKSPTSEAESELCDNMEIALGQSTVESSSNVSASSGELESSTSESGNCTAINKKHKATSPPSPSSLSSKRFKLSDNPANNEDLGNTASETSFASDRDKGCDDFDSLSSSDTETEEVLRVESKAPKIETPTLKLKSTTTTTTKRTPLPNTPAKCSPPVAAPNKAASPKPVKRGSKWSAEEDALLISFKNEGKNFDYISERLSGRSGTACRRHYDQISRASATASKSVSGLTKTSRKPVIGVEPAARKGRWTDDEIDELRRLKMADVEWTEIAKLVPGRTPAACRRKWEEVCREASKLFAMSGAQITQKALAGAVKEGVVEGGNDDGLSENDVKEEKAKRDVDEDSYSCGSDEEMSENGTGDQETRGEIKEEVVEGVSGGDTSDTSSESDEVPSDSESEEEAEKKRQHKTFFLER
jgi:hypothetical protein